MSNPVIPRPVGEMLSWLTQRVTDWAAGPVAIGLTAGQVTALQAALTAATNSSLAADKARMLSKDATLTLQVNASALRTLAQDCVDRIRTFALSSANPDAIFVLAHVPPPSAPVPTPAPTVPTEVAADPNADGTVTIRWTGSVAASTFFTIWRKVGEAGEYAQIGAVAARKFMDFAVPNPGSTQGAPLFYVVRSQRGTVYSAASIPATITYGAGPGFAALAGLKMAA